MLDVVGDRWRESSAWDVVEASIGRFGAQAGREGVTLELLDHVDLATVIVRNGCDDRSRDIVTQRFSLPVPETGRAAFGERGSLVWSAPDQWLAVASKAGDLDYLTDDLKDIAAVTDQGDGRALVRISGPAAIRALAKSIAIDLHPDVFGSGCAATTAMAHVSVQLWAEPKPSTFMIAIPRTMAGTILRCLTSSAAEFGYVILRGP